MGANLSKEESPRHFDVNRRVVLHNHHANNISGDSGYYSSYLKSSETDKAGQFNGKQVVERNNMLHEGAGTVRIDREPGTARYKVDALIRLMEATNHRLPLFKGLSGPLSAGVAVANKEEATMFGYGQGYMQGGPMPTSGFVAQGNLHHAKQRRNALIMQLDHWRGEPSVNAVPPATEFGFSYHPGPYHPGSYHPGVLGFHSWPATNLSHRGQYYSQHVPLAASPPNRAQAVRAAVTQMRDNMMAGGSGGFSYFRPSDSALQKEGLVEEIGARLQGPPGQFYVSPNYRGDLSNPKNRSADIRDDENCALWILGLPAETTHHKLLGAIRGVGKVYSAVINPPNDVHPTCAAKVVFFTRAQAEALMGCCRQGAFVVMGKPIYNVRWNSIKSEEYKYPGSRAIRISGPEALMNFGYFDGLFNSKFTFDLDARGIVASTRPFWVTHEWHFGSFRSQAESAKMLIERELRGIFTVEWANDPCESLFQHVPYMQYV